MSDCNQLSRECSYNSIEDWEYTALQFAVRKESLDQVRYLLESDSTTELDVGPDPALHLALRKGNVKIAKMLVEAGADFETKDSHEDYPIHIACSLGLLEIVQDLCALGCSLEVKTAKGLTALHLAAKYGHLAVVRCLCAAGCNLEAQNSHSIRADITALKYGYNNIAELLDKLRISGQRDHFTRQLVPTSKHTVRLNLRLLGNCGVGKTAMAKSLGAGLFRSLFRKSSSLQSNKSSRPSSPINTQIEMDVTSTQNSVNFDTPPNYNSTNGIHIQSSDISNVGDVVMWDFSGQECYFPVYHHFLWPSPNTVTAILFSLDDPASIQLQQVCFWLNFLIARQNSELPTCEYGNIVLVATHVDLTRAAKNQHGEWVSPDAQNIMDSVKKQLPFVPHLMENVIIIDCNVPASPGFKQFKNILSNVKQDCIQQTLGTSTGLLEHSITWLTNLRHDYEQFPLINRLEFTDLLRKHVNLLASDEHVDDLLEQLHIMGEIHCVNHLIVISLPWLGTQLLGELLSTNFITHSRITGVYTPEDFQATFNEYDSVGVLQLLEAFHLCIHCDIEEEIEYEFPIYNQMETIEDLWDPTDPRYTSFSSIYGGVRLYASSGILHAFRSIFTHLQVELRKTHLTTYLNSDTIISGNSDLYQWNCGSKMCHLDLECLVTLQEDYTGNQFVEIKVRGPENSSECCFYFLENIAQTIYKAINLVCPGLLTETHILSPEELKIHCDDPFCYDPQLITSAMLEAESTLDVAFLNRNTDNYETVVQLIMFDDMDLARQIQWGCVLSIRDLRGPTKLRLCGMLDPPDAHGRDWCLLALKLGVCQKRIASLNSIHSSHTMRLLNIADCTIGCLISSLLELDRQDAAEVVFRSAPIFRVVVEQVEV